MEQTLFDFILDIPKFVSLFATWLLNPINETYLNISPLGLFSVAGFSIFIGIIAIHIVRLFV